MNIADCFSCDQTATA